MEDLPSDQREDEAPVRYPRAQPELPKRNHWRTFDLLIAATSLIYGVISSVAVLFSPNPFEDVAIGLIAAVLISLLSFRGTPLFWIVALPIALIWRLNLWAVAEDLYSPPFTVAVLEAGVWIWAIVGYAALRSVLNLVQLIRHDR